MQGRSKLPSRLSGLLRSQVIAVIQEANLGEEDTRIAELGLDRSTVSKRMKRIIEKVERTADRMEPRRKKPSPGGGGFSFLCCAWQP